LDWFVTNKLPLRNSAGNIIGVMGTLRSYEGSRKSMLPYSQISDVVDFIREHHRGKITVAEVASLMRVSKMTVYRLVHGGDLPAVRVGRSFRVPEQAVHDYLRTSFIEAG